MDMKQRKNLVVEGNLQARNSVDSIDYGLFDHQ